MESPLKKFTAQEWDWFLTIEADCLAPCNSCLSCIYEMDCMGACLFCKAYYCDCHGCMPHSEFGCGEIKMWDKVDRAIERLEDAGVFDLDET